MNLLNISNGTLDSYSGLLPLSCKQKTGVRFVHQAHKYWTMKSLPSLTKEKSLSSLIHELDGVFSRFIRKRDTHNGFIKCFVCGYTMSFQEAQCGHYVDRDQMPTRYDEMNCHSVCQECNCFDTEHKARYGDIMFETYGEWKINKLAQKSKSLQKYFKFEIEELIELYKDKIKELKK